MRRSHSLEFTSSGVVCSVGLSAPTASAAIRGALSGFRESYFLDASGEMIMGAAVPDAALERSGVAEDLRIPDEEVRCASMFVRAARECLDGSAVADTERVAVLFLARDGAETGEARAACERRMKACTTALGRSFHADGGVVQGGRAGIAEALTIADRLLTDQGVASVMIAGVDSLLNTADISAALARERLRTNSHSDGLIPGEAAACMMVRRGNAGRPTFLSIEGFGAANEPCSFTSESYCTGIGLASAIRQALQRASLEASAVGHRFSDCSGESYFFDESAYAWGRVLRAPGPPNYRQHLIAASIGDVGSAGAPLALAVCREAALRGWMRSHYALLHFSSLGGERAAVVVKRSPPRPEP